MNNRPKPRIPLPLPVDLGEVTNVEVMGNFLNLAGRQVVDAGCGGMAFTRHLAELGAKVLAVDPDREVAARNRQRAPIDGVEFVETGAHQLPVADQSIDGVFFAYSLHHVPAKLYPAVFEEVFRVLRPNGFLYVIEPIDCPLNQVMKHFYDEDQQRLDAWDALIELAVPRFLLVDAVTYHGYTQYESFEDFAVKFSNKAFDSIYSEADVRNPKVEAAFYEHGDQNSENGFRFASPKNAMVLRQFNAQESADV